MVASVISPTTRPSASATPTAFDDEIALRFPYAAALVDDLKTEIPARYRRYDRNERVWYVTGPYREMAVDLLLARYPRADVPGRAVVVRPTPAPKAPEKPAPRPAPVAATDAPAVLLAGIPCPRCHAVYAQPLRVTAKSSATASKRPITPELAAVCPSCGGLAVLSVTPAGSPAAAAA